MQLIDRYAKVGLARNGLDQERYKVLGRAQGSEEDLAESEWATLSLRRFSRFLPRRPNGKLRAAPPALLPHSLAPTQVRFKHRYLLISLVFPATLSNPLSLSASTDGPLPVPPQLTEGGIITLLRESLSVNFGDVGAGEVGGQFSSESCWALWGWRRE